MSTQSSLEATLYSLPQNELLYADQAETLAAECFLKMSSFFKIRREERSNVQNMSQCNSSTFAIINIPGESDKGEVLQNYLQIVKFVKSMQKNRSSANTLAAGDAVVEERIYNIPDESDEQRLKLCQILELCNRLKQLELYINWCHEPTYLKATQARFQRQKPWPLRQLLTHQRKNFVTNHLKSIGIYPSDIGKIEKEMQSILAILDDCLKHTDFFFNDSLPTELDALVFGHVFTLLATKGVDDRIQQLVHQFQNLVNFSMNINDIYFKNHS